MNLQFAGPRTAAFPALLGGGFGFTAEWCCRRASKLCFQYVPWICNTSPWFKTPMCFKTWTTPWWFEGGPWSYDFWIYLVYAYNMDSEGYESTLKGNITTSESRKLWRQTLTWGFVKASQPSGGPFETRCLCRADVAGPWICGFVDLVFEHVGKHEQDIFMIFRV